MFDIIVHIRGAFVSIHSRWAILSRITYIQSTQDETRLVFPFLAATGSFLSPQINQSCCPVSHAVSIVFF